MSTMLLTQEIRESLLRNGHLSEELSRKGDRMPAFCTIWLYWITRQENWMKPPFNSTAS
jgi:hypothetical protein